MLPNQNTTTINVLVVGDASAGKTELLLSFIQDKVQNEYMPKVFENFIVKVKVNNKIVDLSLSDGAGQENYSRLRQLTQSNKDIFLLLFSVVDQDSYNNMLSKWYPDVNQGDNQQKPKIIVGTQIEKRDETNDQHIKKVQGEAKAKDLGFKYFECSALTKQGLDDLFQETAKLGLQAQLSINNNNSNDSKEKKQKCLVQ